MRKVDFASEVAVAFVMVSILLIILLMSGVVNL